MHVTVVCKTFVAFTEHKIDDFMKFTVCNEEIKTGEYVCNKRKNITTHNFHSLVHHVYVISKEELYFTLQY